MTDIFNPWADETVGGFAVRSSFPGALSGAVRGGIFGHLGLGYAQAQPADAMSTRAVDGPRLRSLAPIADLNQPVLGVLPARRQVLTS